RRAAPRGLRDGALQRWPSLPGTKAEVQAIARSFHQRFGDGPVTRLEQARATEGALRHEAGRHRYLHLATHGFFAPSELTSALDQEPNPGAGAAAAPEGPDDFFRQRGVTGYHP